MSHLYNNYDPTQNSIPHSISPVLGSSNEANNYPSSYNYNQYQSSFNNSHLVSTSLNTEYAGYPNSHSNYYSKRKFKFFFLDC